MYKSKLNSKILNTKVLWFLCFICTSVSGELVDPTAPTNYAAESATAQSSVQVINYNLQAILISDVNRVAVINDNVVKIGDLIGDGEVSAIDSNKVTLVGAQGKLELKLIEESVKELAK